MGGSYNQRGRNSLPGNFSIDRGGSDRGGGGGSGRETSRDDRYDRDRGQGGPPVTSSSSNNIPVDEKWKKPSFDEPWKNRRN